jgi:hypothetical protein
MALDIHGHKTTLTVAGTAIGEIFNISGPNKTRGTVDTTAFDSADSTKTYEALQYSDAGELTIDLKYDGTTGATNPATLLRTVYDGNSNVQWVMTFGQEGGIFTCSGHITALGHAIPLDDKVTQSVSVKLTGAGAWT